MDPVIEEFVRARQLRPDVMSRMQRHFRDVIHPIVEEHAILVEKVHRLEAELDAARVKQARKKEAVGA